MLFLILGPVMSSLFLYHVRFFHKGWISRKNYINKTLKNRLYFTSRFFLYPDGGILLCLKSFLSYFFVRKPSGFQWSALAWCDLERSDAYVPSDYVCLWRFKIASCKRALLKFTRFSQKKKVGYFSNSVVYLNNVSFSHLDAPFTTVLFCELLLGSCC